MISDMHVHTIFSCDSETTMEEYCEEAIMRGVSHICFTDHIDYNKNDYGYNYYQPDEFFKDYMNVQEKYADRITLTSGIEFSEPHIYPKEFECLSKLPYDYIIGSIHYWIDNLFANQMEAHGINMETAFEKYWDEIHKAVSFGGFDCIAHFDFPKRYYKHSLWSHDKIVEIYKIMLKNDISLEINTSSLRKGLSVTMPDQALVDLYRETGGTMITIGSDAHKAIMIGNGFHESLKMIVPPLVNGYYKKRKFIKF